MCEEKNEAPPPKKKKRHHIFAQHSAVLTVEVVPLPHTTLSPLSVSQEITNLPRVLLCQIVMSMLSVVIDIVAGFKLSHRRIFHKCEFTCAPNVTGCAVTKAKPSIEITESRTNTITVGV